MYSTANLSTAQKLADGEVKPEEPKVPPAQLAAEAVASSAFPTPVRGTAVRQDQPRDILEGDSVALGSLDGDDSED